MKLLSEDNLWNLLRLSLSLILLWAFFDKVFGLGFATTQGKSWLAGVSPTAGFLLFSPKGTFAQIFHSLSGNILVDYLFMSGLFLVGLSLLLGIGIRIACLSGSLLMFLIYLSLFPPINNPILDDHIIYIIIFLLILRRSQFHDFGLSAKWKKTSLVKKYPVLS